MKSNKILNILIAVIAIIGAFLFIRIFMEDADLLKEDGVIFVHIDDEMFPYLAIVMDEIFDKKNRLNVIAVKMSEASGVKMSHVDKRLPKLKEYILSYKKKINF